MSIALIDFSSLFHRLWHVNRDEAAHKCISFLHGLSGFDEVIVCIDSPPYKRKDIEPSYKANRDVPDPELVGQLRESIRKASEAGYTIASCDGWEADDVIATIVSKSEESITVYGTDKDLLQCYDLTVPFTGEVKTPESTLGVPREKVIDYLCLCGDTSDNVKGVSGVGPKTSIAMLEKFGSLSGIYDALKNTPSRFSEKTGEALFESLSWIDTTRQLITLNKNLDVKFEKRDPNSRNSHGESNMFEEDEHALNETEGQRDQVRVVPAVQIQKVPDPQYVVKTEPVDYRHALEPMGIQQAYRTAEGLYRSGLYQQFKSPEQIMLVIMRGRELGIGAATSLEIMHVIQGRPTMSAQCIAALIMRSEQCEYLVCRDMSDESCTWETKRKGNPCPSSRTFTIEEARRMKLTDKDNWKKQPNVMLQWRCCASLCRREYPDLMLGIYATEEME